MCFIGNVCFIYIICIYLWILVSTSITISYDVRIFTSNTRDATSGLGTAFPSAAPQFIPVWCGWYWDVTSGSGTASPSGAQEFILVFGAVRVGIPLCDLKMLSHPKHQSSFLFWLVSCCSIFGFPFSVFVTICRHCLACPSTYGFCVPLVCSKPF